MNAESGINDAKTLLRYEAKEREWNMKVKKIDGQGRYGYSLVKPGGVTSTFGENLEDEITEKNDSRPYPA